MMEKTVLSQKGVGSLLSKVLYHLFVLTLCHPLLFVGQNGDEKNFRMVVCSPLKEGGQEIWNPSTFNL